jgi:predicted dehydrogenase
MTAAAARAVIGAQQSQHVQNGVHFMRRLNAIILALAALAAGPVVAGAQSADLIVMADRVWTGDPDRPWSDRHARAGPTRSAPSMKRA